METAKINGTERIVLQQMHLNFGFPSILKRLHSELGRPVNLLCKYLVAVSDSSCTTYQCVVLWGSDLGPTIFMLPKLHSY